MSDIGGLLWISERNVSRNRFQSLKLPSNDGSSMIGSRVSMFDDDIYGLLKGLADNLALIPAANP